MSRHSSQPFLPDEPDFDDDFRSRDPRRESTSTLNSTRRSAAYDSQRISYSGRPSPRPPSGASQHTVRSRSRSKHRSYQQPGDFDVVDENAVPPPARAQEQYPHLEDERYRLPDQPGTLPVRNFSQPLHRRRPSGSNSRDINPSDVSALPPVPKQQRMSTHSAPRSVHSNREQLQSQVPQPQDAEQGHTSERSDEERPYSSRHPHELMRPSPPLPRWLTELFTVSYLIFFSILGTLARLGLQWLTFYPGAPITTPVVWANMVGSMIMGFISEDQGLFRDPSQAPTREEKRQSGDLAQIDKAELANRKKTIPLYIGLATGFCGSFTSFSSFARDFFLAMSNSLPAPVYHTYSSPAGPVLPSTILSRNGGYSFEALVGVVLYTLALSLGGLFVGAHMAIFLEDITRPIPVTFVRKLLDPLMVFLAWGCWLGAVFLCIWPPDRPGGPSSRGSWSNETWRGEVLFALVFAPVGCILRFYASLKLNGLVPWFPLGTFAVNMFGTAVEGMCYDIQHVGVGHMGRIGGGRVGCQVLQGVQDGFCGCLTTVSTWVSEINALKRKHGYLYALATVLSGLCLMVIIMGSVRWSVGFSPPVCNTGYPSKVHG